MQILARTLSMIRCLYFDADKIRVGRELIALRGGI